MASSDSSGSTQLQNSASLEDLQVLMEQRKRKRMQSNRESARRSRLRKQKQLDDLTAQVARLRNENSEMITTVGFTHRSFLSLEAENSVLRAQMAELSHLLESLNNILSFMNSNNGVFVTDDCLFMGNSPLNLVNFNQPIMASADVFRY